MSAKASSKTAAASTKRTRVVVLQLSPDQLAQFPSDTSSTQSSSIKPDPSPSINLPDSADQASDSNNATPVPAGAADADLLAPPETTGRKKKADSSTRKRAPPSIDPNKERGRPGPKKKPRLPDGSIDRTNDKNPSTLLLPPSSSAAAASTPQPLLSATNPTNAPHNLTAGGAAAANHKLGPKAHAGPINAGLRALDRTGKPCRKWARAGLTLKSFTGTAWGMQTWKAPLLVSSLQQGAEEFPGDVKSDSADSSDLGGGGAGGANHKPSSAAAAGPLSERDAGGGGGRGDAAAAEGLQVGRMMESSPAPGAVLA